MVQIIKAHYVCESCHNVWETNWKDYSEADDCPKCGDMTNPMTQTEIPIDIHVRYGKVKP